MLDGPFAADLSFEDFPVVDAVPARLAGVTDQDAALEFIEIDAQFDAMLAAGGKFNRGGAAKGRRVVVLGASGNVDDDSLGVAADMRGWSRRCRPRRELRNRSSE